MERPIGERFRLTEYHPGLPETIAILEVVAEQGCEGCYLKGICMSRGGQRLKEICGLCYNGSRTDETSVIFKKIKYL